MSATSILDAEVAAKVETLQAIPTRMPSDIRDDLVAVLPGLAKYQLLMAAAGRSEDDSNVATILVQVALTVTHYLANPFDERVYRLGAMAEDLEATTAASWWDSMLAVQNIDPNTEPALTITRSGNNVSWRYTLVLETLE